MSQRPRTLSKALALVSDPRMKRLSGSGASRRAPGKPSVLEEPTAIWLPIRVRRSLRPCNRSAAIRMSRFDFAIVRTS